MGKRENCTRGFIFLLIGALLMVGGYSAWATTPPPDAAVDPAKADPGQAAMVLIDTLSSFGPLERPPVVFLHDRHTQALAEQQKDCLTCHPVEDNRLSAKFKRTENSDKQAVMDIYHTQCIECHTELQAANAVSGPVTCGECHRADPAPPSTRRPMQLDKSLHFRHTRALDNKCDQCHHQYNEQTKTLIYVKGQEGACLYCHKAQTEENRISNRLAAHGQCIDCHRQKISQNQDAGPIVCGGCHAPESQQAIEKPSDIPRVVRNQPDAVLIKNQPPVLKGPSVQPRSGLGPVAFDHRSHETYNESCRVCHHADLGSCARCHTRTGTTEGRGVNLTQAMHLPGAAASCVGCHHNVQGRAQCIGCHQTTATGVAVATDASCSVCHRQLPDPGRFPNDPSVPNVPDIPDNPEAARALAANWLAQRPRKAPLMPMDQIPETVTLKHLVDQYEAVAMPHRKIVLALAAGIQDNPLAINFHQQPTTLCLGCHHNAPGSVKPPACASCHGQTSDTLNPNRPGLLAAYHQQCMDCHEHMGIEKPASRQCTACHAQRTPNQANR